MNIKTLLSLAVISAALAAAAQEADATAAATEAAAATETAAAETAVAESVAVEVDNHIYSRLFQLNHASATEVAEKFNSMWSGEFGQVWKVAKMAVAFEESNTLMLTAPNPILKACEAAIAELDVEARQVYIEARFVELGNTASRKLGIDWSMLGGMTASLSAGGGIQGSRVGSAVSDYTRTYSGKNESSSYTISGGSGANGTISYFNGTLSVSDLYLTLKALDSTEDVKIFSNPKIIVSSGKKATVDMTTKYPNVVIATKRTLNGNSDSIDLDMKMSAIPGEDKMLFAKEAFFSWGISLEVTPRISTNGLINVQVIPTISSLDSTQGEGGFVTASGSSSETTAYSAKYPIIEMQRLITEFNMASGTTAVIGGLSRTTEKQVDNGIPFLRSIPLIGPWLFGSMERVKEQREIIVFVTVGLVDPKNMRKDAGLPKNAVLGRQYTKSQKLEPGDRPEKNMEGFDSLDLRLLEEQARDPLRKQSRSGNIFDLGEFFPFYKGQETKPETQQGTK